MASKEQYDVFKWLYDEESSRRKAHLELCRLYISLLTLYSGFLIFVAKDQRPASFFQWLLFAASATCLAIAFFLSVSAATIAEFEAANTPENIVNSFTRRVPSNDKFFDDRIADLTVAYQRNSRVSDRKANKLMIAGYFLLAGIVAHLLYFLQASWPKGGTP